MRYLIGGLAAACALAFAPAASANHVFACEPGFEAICTVNDLGERVLCGRYVTC